jgi:cytochrome c-type biogenesis protein CcmH
MLLWIVFAVMTAIVALAIVRPYWRPDSGANSSSHDLAVYKQQLQEIEDEKARGLLGDAEFASARIEISRRILAASDASDSARIAANASPVAPYVMIALLVTLAMGIYLIYGSPQLRDQPLSARISPDGAPPIEMLVARVEERLRSHPGDGAGWGVIAPVYMRLGRYADAASAYGKVIELLGETPDRLGDLGEALTYANDGMVGDEARAAFQKAQAKEPSNARAGFWLGVADEQSGKLADAANAYKTLIGRGLPPNVEAVVKQRLAGVEVRLSGAPAPSPSADQAAMIDGMVSGLAERLKADGSDLEGWLKLMRAYTVLGRRNDALGALKQAQSQFAGNQEALGQIERLAKSLGLTS